MSDFYEKSDIELPDCPLAWLETRSYRRPVCCWWMAG